jgi:acyl-CoA thioester hydrolase
MWFSRSIRRCLVLSKATDLRANATDAERLLWSKLRDRHLVGAKFRRQVPFPPYTVDFCCFEAKLIVEVDGGQHAVQVARDAVRTARLERDGFSVLRFWNNDVLSNIDGVLEPLALELRERSAPPRCGKSDGASTHSRRRVMAARSSAPSALVGEGEGAPAGKNSHAPHLHRIRVYFEDTDAGGMVYYANYLKFAERARTEMLRSAGISHAQMVADDGVMLVVRRCNAEYLRSARLDDELEVETRIVECARASLTLNQRVLRGTELLAELKVTIACVSREGRPIRLPERVREAIAIN